MTTFPWVGKAFYRTVPEHQAHKVIETKLCSFSQEVSRSGQRQYPQCPNSPASNTYKIIEMLQIAMSSTAISRAPPGGSSAGLDSPCSASGTSGEKWIRAEAPRSRELFQSGRKLGRRKECVSVCLIGAQRNMTACWRNVCRVPGSGKDTSSKCHAGFQLMEGFAGCIKRNVRREFRKVLQGNTLGSGQFAALFVLQLVKTKRQAPSKINWQINK